MDETEKQKENPDGQGLDWDILEQGAADLRQELLGGDTQIPAKPSTDTLPVTPQKYDQWIKATGFMLLAMVGLSIYGLFNTFMMVLSTGDFEALYAPIMIPRYVDFVLMAMVTRGVFKRDEFWGLWAGCLFVSYILIHHYVILPIHLGMPVISFYFSILWFVSTFFPFILGFLLIKPLVSMKKLYGTWGEAVSAIWWRTEGSKFFFVLLCLGTLLPSLALLYPSIIGKILTGLGALAMLDTMGPTKITGRGHTQAEAEADLNKAEDRHTAVFFIAVGMVMYGLSLMEFAG